MNLLIEGWRFIPHSYACVNMWQCLELIKYDKIKLYHNDVGFCSPNWTCNYSIFEQSMTDTIKNIAGLQHIEQADAIYRIHYPYNLSPVMDKPVTCFMTCESYHILPNMSLALIILAILAQRAALRLSPPQTGPKTVWCGVA